MARGNIKKKLLRILIIEDNIDHIELLSAVIERHFAPVDLHTVESINDAIDFIEQTEYDIVLTDCFINNESIVDQIPSLKAKLGKTPIIVITGSGDESLAAEIIKQGATDYLAKSRDSLEKVPPLINKYTQVEAKAPVPQKADGTAPPPIQEKIINEMASLGRQARRMSSTRSSRIPDAKQLESLLDQITRLKDLASKLMNK